MLETNPEFAEAPTWDFGAQFFHDADLSRYDVSILDCWEAASSSVRGTATFPYLRDVLRK